MKRDYPNYNFARAFWIAVLSIAVLIGWITVSHAALQDCTLTWNPNSEADLKGYHVYAQSKGSGQFIKGQYQADIPAGTNSAKCLADMRLTIPGTYFFALTAYDNATNESDFSSEVSKELKDIPPVGTPGAIPDFKLTPDIGSMLVSLTVPDDGTGKPATVDVRYEEGNTIGWGGATQFACLSFPCKVVGLKQGLTYTFQAIPVRRVPGSPSVFGPFVAPQSAKTLSDIPPIDPPPDKPRDIQISVLEKDGSLLLSIKKEDLIK